MPGRKSCSNGHGRSCGHCDGSVSDTEQAIWRITHRCNHIRALGCALCRCTLSSGVVRTRLGIVGPAIDDDALKPRRVRLALAAAQRQELLARTGDAGKAARVACLDEHNDVGAAVPRLAHHARPAGVRRQVGQRKGQQRERAGRLAAPRSRRRAVGAEGGAHGAQRVVVRQQLEHVAAGTRQSARLVGAGVRRHAGPGTGGGPEALAGAAREIGDVARRPAGRALAAGAGAEAVCERLQDLDEDGIARGRARREEVLMCCAHCPVVGLG